jgi:hypothetical protein
MDIMEAIVETAVAVAANTTIYYFK